MEGEGDWAIGLAAWNRGEGESPETTEKPIDVFAVEAGGECILFFWEPSERAKKIGKGLGDQRESGNRGRMGFRLGCKGTRNGLRFGGGE